MVNASDPTAIPYIIQENGYYYVAYKAFDPSKGYVSVSAKGVVNGLSTVFNDGADFGPDSYDPMNTASPPYTLTSGIQEALDTGLPVHMSDGVFPISASILIDKSGAVLIGSGYGQNLSGTNVGTVIEVTKSGIDAIQIDNSVGASQDNISDFRIVFDTTLTSTGYGINFINSVSNSTNISQSYFARITTFNAQGYAYNFSNFLNCVFEQVNMQNCKGHLNITSVGNGQDNAGNSVFIECKSFSVSSGTTLSTLNINGSASSTNGGGVQQLLFSRCEFEYASNTAITINNVNTVAFNQCTVDGMGSTPPTTLISLTSVFGIKFDTLNISGNGSTTISITTSTQVYFYNTIAITSGAVISITKDSTSANIYFIGSTGSIFSTSSTFELGAGLNSPHLPSNVSGTTAGSFTATQIHDSPSYKKVMIYLDAYENDSTTAQTYTFPVAFSTVAEITANTASVPVVSTSLTEFSIAPDTTTAYTGIIVIEGY